MSDDRIDMPDALTAEEELLQWSGELAPVSVSLRQRVLGAVREQVRRRQSRREMQWVAAGLLSWVFITATRAEDSSGIRARIVAAVPHLGNARSPVSADAEQTAHAGVDGLLSRVATNANIEMQRLDDSVNNSSNLHAVVTNRHSVAGDLDQFWTFQWPSGTEAS